MNVQLNTVASAFLETAVNFLSRIRKTKASTEATTPIAAKAAEA